jgi:predicted PurR-regulated permease PerM
MSLITPQRLQAGGWIAVGLAVLLLLYLLAPVLTPFALAAIVAYLLVPGVDWLQRHRLPRSAAVLLMIALAGLALLAMLLILVPVLQREIKSLQLQLPGLITWLNSSVAPKINELAGTTVRFDAQTLRELLAEHAAGQGDLIARLVAQARAGGAALIGVLGTLLLVPVVLFYALADWHDFARRFEGLLPRRWHALVVGMLAEIDALLAQFLRGQLSVMAALAVYYSAALALAGFQSALPIGILTGLLAFIPYVGFATGLGLALLVGALQFGSLYGLVAVAVIYGLGQVIESFLLTPRLVGERIGLHPLAVIFALLAFGQLFGFFGVLLALPASAVLLVGGRRLKAAYLDSEFYKTI